MAEKIIKHVSDTISKFGMIKKGESILIAVSGGPDSIFLTKILLILNATLELELSCFHLDHCTRNGESRRDAEFVEGFCRENSLKLHLKRIDCEKWCKKNSLTFQEGARLLRISQLRQIAGEQKIHKIATGHTADDNIETFFLNLFRGAGLSGLRGISPVEENIIRPLIETRRKDIMDYLHRNRIDYRIDRTNLENRYERNRIRNLLVPFIKQNFSESFDERLLKTIDIIRNEDIFMTDYATGILKEIAKFNMEKSGQGLWSIEIPVKKLDKYPDSLKKRIFIEAIKKIKGNAEDIKRINLEDLLVHCYSGGEKKEITLAGDLIFKKESDSLLFELVDNSPVEGSGQWNYRIEIGKEQVFKQQDIKILSRLMEGGPEKIKKQKVLESEAYMDFDKISPPVFVRNWQKNTGEKFHPLGTAGSKKIHDFFIDKKIPYSKRRSFPVFTDTEKIIWIGKLRLDERVKLETGTRKILYIKIFDI